MAFEHLHMKFFTHDGENTSDYLEAMDKVDPGRRNDRAGGGPGGDDDDPVFGDAGKKAWRGEDSSGGPPSALGGPSRSAHRRSLLSRRDGKGDSTVIDRFTSLLVPLQRSTFLRWIHYKGHWFIHWMRLWFIEPMFIRRRAVRLGAESSEPQSGPSNDDTEGLNGHHSDENRLVVADGGSLVHTGKSLKSKCGCSICRAQSIWF